ncbi:MAG: hypothetical protein MJ082_05465, partial [Clostridia bacterium]|nr:hypothetical protein [Clostridia bacterium]
TLTAKTFLAGQNLWDNDFYVTFNLRFDENMTGFEYRLRNAKDVRDKIFTVSATGLITPFQTYLTPAEGSAASYQLEGYGWHQIGVLYHQETVADDVNKTVSDSVKITICVDGKPVLVCDGLVDAIKGKFGLLYTSAYDETAEGHIKYANAGNNLYAQIYQAKFKAKTDLIFECYGGEARVLPVGTLPEVTRLAYVLNGGTLKETEVTEAISVLDLWYFTCDQAELPIPEHEQLVFDGWYATSDFSDEKIDAESPDFSVLTPDENGVITLYAKYVQATAGTEGDGE